MPLGSQPEISKTFSAVGLEIIEIKKGGEILVSGEPSKRTMSLLKTKLDRLGFSLIEDNRARIIARAKALLENLVSEDSFTMKFKISEHLASKMAYEYHYLSGLFSQLEGITIERFLIQLKIEKIKEMIRRGDMKITEISYKLGYSSPAHLTNQFKKIEGVTPSAFRTKIRQQLARN